MAEINLSPYTAESEAIARRIKMAELLQQQSMQPLETPGMAGGYQLAISPYAGLAKILQGYTARQAGRSAEAERKALGDRYQKESMEDITKYAEMASRPAVAAVQGQDAFMPTGADYQDRGGAPDFKLDEQGMVPAVSPVAGRMRGQIDPAMVGQFKTPDMQRMALAQLLKQGELPAAFNLGADETRFQPPVGGGPAVAVATGKAKPLPSPFSPLDVSKFTPESVKAAMKPGGTIDMTLLVPIAESRSGQLGVYDEYVKQEIAAGRVPIGIKQFETEQKIAGRTPAAPRERTVFDSTRGGTVNLDTKEFIPVVQKGVPIGGKGRPLPTSELDKITAIDVSFGTQKRLAETFQDSYGGSLTKIGGELANIFGSKFGGDYQAQAEWWASHEANDNVSRNALFGASLTAGEQKAWDRTTINPGMDSTMIKNRMIERQNLIDAKRKTMIGNLDKAGYDVKNFKDSTNFYTTAEKPVQRARNSTTGEEIISTDGGNTWQPAGR